MHHFLILCNRFSSSPCCACVHNPLAFLVTLYIGAKLWWCSGRSCQLWKRGDGALVKALRNSQSHQSSGGRPTHFEQLGDNNWTTTTEVWTINDRRAIELISAILGHTWASHECTRTNNLWTPYNNNIFQKLAISNILPHTFTSLSTLPMLSPRCVAQLAVARLDCCPVVCHQLGCRQDDRTPNNLDNRGYLRTP